MKTYIALLRGINVGGKNKINMKDLKEIFENLGFEDVKTYINSGNVIFKSSITDLKELINLCEKVIKNRFNLTIPLVINEVITLSKQLKKAPEEWHINDKEIINYAIFILASCTVSEVLTTMGEIKPEYEKLSYSEDIIFWSSKRDDFSKTVYSKIANSKVNNKVTIRTANTIHKLINLADKK